ncbi:hypothetical protein PLICRDRAFT_178858 [Plicaturopsis crispa FD-325 SS-3]|uniref:F-box domain-containing protein n=1 Tax=Plicaturopsis crispa FD-325 SS-3 TaxID=944288 RepID=A0A0C9SL97_PLICR|nr:hypothetical protein PLICRDRAFT_178858 [Plicaturopsis crispa FD-325 SS-3]
MTDTEAQPIMDAILPHVQRWRLFSLHDPETWQIIERLEDFAAPLLECLWISTNDIWDKPGGLDLFRDAPRSQELRMCGVSLENCRPPVGSVKTFHFRVTAWQEWYSFHHFRSMFMDFASLTTLVLQGTVVDVEAEDAESDGWHVDLPLLTTLVVECRTCLDDYVVALLEALNVPNLHTLVLHLSDDTEEDSEKEWYSDLKGLAALSPKFGALQTLHLQSKMSQAFVRPFMKAFPNITTLILGHMTREFFIMMHVVGSLSDESWRRLRTLTIGAIHYPAHSKDGRFIEDVVSFVKSARKGRRSPVDTVRVGSGIVCQGRPAVRSIRAQLSGAGVTVEEIPEDLDIQYQRLMKEGEFCEVEDVDDESGSGDTDEGALVDLD